MHRPSASADSTAADTYRPDHAWRRPKDQTAPATPGLETRSQAKRRKIQRRRGAGGWS